MLAAASSGNVDALQRALSSSSSTTRRRDGEGLTAFLAACLGGHVSCAELLLASVGESVLVDRVEPTHDSVWHVAALSGSCDVLRFLSAHDALHVRVDEVNVYGTSPWHLVCQHGSMEMVTFMLDTFGSRIDTKRRSTTYQWNAGLHAAYGGRADVLRFLLAQGLAKLDDSDRDGWTPLLLACRQGHWDVVRAIQELDPSRVESETSAQLNAELSAGEPLSGLDWTARAMDERLPDGEDGEELYRRGRLYFRRLGGANSVDFEWAMSAKGSAFDDEGADCDEDARGAVAPQFLGNVAVSSASPSPGLEAASAEKPYLPSDLRWTSVSCTTDALDREPANKLLICQIHDMQRLCRGQEANEFQVPATCRVCIGTANTRSIFRYTCPSAAVPLFLRRPADGKDEQGVYRADAWEWSGDQSSWFPHLKNVEESGYWFLLDEMFILNSLYYSNEYRWNALLIAASKGHREVVQGLLDTCPELGNQRFGDGRHLLHVSVAHVELLSWLCVERAASLGLSLEDPDTYGLTPFLLAVREQHLDSVQWLLERFGTTVDFGQQRDKDSMSCTLHAVCTGNVSLLRLLLKHGMNARDRDRQQNTLLHWACASGFFPLVRYLLEEVGLPSGVTDEYGNTPYMRAAKTGQTTIAKYFIAKGFTTVNDQSNTSTMSALMWAANNGHVNTALELLTQGANPHLTDDNGSNFLHSAAGGGSVELVRLCVEQLRMDPACRTTRQWTPLLFAAQSGHLDIVRYLIEEAHVDPQEANEYGCVPLAIAAHKGHDAVVLYLIEVAKVDIHVLDQNRATPLVYSAIGGHVSTARLLIDAGADPMHLPTNGFTPLLEATYAGERSLALCRYFLEELNLSVTQTTRNGGTALHWAANTNKTTELVEYLLDTYPDDLPPSVVDSNGATPLHYACSGGRLDSVKVLLARGASMTERNSGALTPFLCAATRSCKDVLEYFLQEGLASQTEEDYLGYQALQWVVKRGTYECAELLIDNEWERADVNHQIHDGRTALHLAVEEREVHMVWLLVNSGADPDLEDRNGVTPRTLAAQLADQTRAPDPAGKTAEEIKAEVAKAKEAAQRVSAQILAVLAANRSHVMSFALALESPESPAHTFFSHAELFDRNLVGLVVDFLVGREGIRPKPTPKRQP